MKKTLIGIAASLAIATSAFAHAQATPSIQLHEKPNMHSKITGPALKVGEPLVVILYSPDHKWAKVASRSNGNVGWISKQDYMTAVKAKNKKEFQSIIVSTDRDQNGKITQTVVAFRNGKQLGKAEAQALYQKLKAQYQNQRRAFRQQQRSMRQMEGNFIRNEQTMMEEFFQPPRFRGHPGPGMPGKRPPFGAKPQTDNPWAE